MCHAYLWEFEVRPGQQAEFERHYGPDGTWARLFRSSADYRGTLLLRDEATPGRYLTLDRWTTEAAFHAFRETRGRDYDALDRQCEHLTRAERPLGSFTLLPDGVE